MPLFPSATLPLMKRKVPWLLAKFRPTFRDDNGGEPLQVVELMQLRQVVSAVAAADPAAAAMWC